MIFLLSCMSPQGADSADTGTVDVSLSLIPDSPTTLSVLTAEALGDPGLASSWAWFRDNTQVTGLDGPMVPAEETARGEVWRVVLSPDGLGVLDQPVTAKVTILNSPPSITLLQLDEAPTVTDNISLTLETEDADGDAIGLEFSWSIDGTLLDDQVGSSLPAGIAVRGQEVSVTVTPSDDADAGAPVTEAVAVDNAPPSAAAITPSADIASAGDTLSVSIEGWHDPDGDEADYLYNWFLNGEVLGESSASLLLTKAHAGGAVHCTAIPFDGIDEGEPLSTSLVVVSPQEDE